MNRELHKTISSTDRALITLVVMAATLMQVIDTTIVNVALPHMQGSLGASSDEITWTLTSYLVSSGIFMPLTGYFSDLFGRKKYFIISIAGFTLVSALCGASASLTQIVFFRLLQGAFGAALVPLSQAILTDIYPPNERGKAMALWGVGVMVGPILGPTLGGYLTDFFSWRSTFYVNIPFGILTLLLANAIPTVAHKKRSMDWLGLILISISIGGLQYVLDRGNQADWFNARSICIISFITITAFLSFLLHNMGRTAQTVFDPRIFRDRNFLIASILLAVFGLGLYGMMVIQPLMMEGLFNYPALTTGLMLAPRGIAGMVSMIIIGKLINRTDPRLFIVIGAMITASGLYIGTYYSLDISPFWFIAPQIVQGFGMGMIFVPLSTIAFSTLSVDMRTEAAGLFSLLRTIGGSIGISITITLFTRRTQFFWNQLGGFIDPYTQGLSHYLNALHLKPHDAVGALILQTELSRQASMVSFINVFAFIMWCYLAMILLVLFLKKGNTPTKIEAVMD